MVGRARLAAKWWAGLGFAGRRTRLLRWRSLLANRITELAALSHLETGKPIADAVVEAVSAIDHLDWAARNAKRVLGPRRVRGRLVIAEFSAHLEYQPYGVVAMIAPWNYPVLTPVGAFGYALAAGNAVILKPSEYTRRSGSGWSTPSPRWCRNTPSSRRYTVSATSAPHCAAPASTRSPSPAPPPRPRR